MRVWGRGIGYDISAFLFTFSPGQGGRRKRGGREDTACSENWRVKRIDVLFWVYC